MDRVRVTGTVLVTPFVAAGLVFGLWGLINSVKHWQALTHGRLLNEAEMVSQIVAGAAAIALALTLTGSLWLRCFPRRRAWEDGAAKLPNPFTTSGKYAVWGFQRPSRRQALFGPLHARKKMRKQSRSYLLGRQPRDGQHFIPVVEAGRDRDGRGAQVQNAVGQAGGGV